MELRAGQVAVVTGAASGIGFGIAEALGRRGLSIVLADIEEGALADAEARIQRLGVPTAVVVTDVADRGQVQALSERVQERFGAVDVVCNNAGVVTDSKATWEMHELDWRWVLGVNMWGVINGIATFVPGMVARGTGHVVNTSSVVGLSIGPEIAPYTASKHAVVALSESLRSELAERSPGVGVTVLCPGYVPTRIGDAQRNRPPGLTPDRATSIEGQARDRSGLAPMAASQVGEMVTEAIETGRFYLTTHPDAGALVHHRFDRIFKEIDPAGLNGALR